MSIVSSGTSVPKASWTRTAALAAWLAVLGLTIFYIVSVIDRNILTMLVKPVERDLHLSDFQMGLLLGPAFGASYGLFGLMVGSILDRIPRNWVLVGSAAIWGVSTCACCFAGSFFQLFFGRLGVAIGESTLWPTGHALIAERFPKERLGLAMTVFALGAGVGTGLATIVGGALVHFTEAGGSLTLPVAGELRSWRLVFLLIGVATLIIAPFALMLSGAPKHDAKDGEQGWAGLWTVIVARPVLFIGAPMGGALITLLNVAYNAWIPTFMARKFGMNMGRIGALLGTQHLIAAPVGLLASGLLVDWLYRRGMTDAHPRVAMYGLCIAAPFGLAAYNVPTPTMFILLISVFYLCTVGALSFCTASVQLFCPPNLRGRVSAMLLAIVVVISTGLGPTTTSWLTQYVLKDKGKLGEALCIVTVVTAIAGVAVLWAVARQMRVLHKTQAVTVG